MAAPIVSFLFNNFSFIKVFVIIYFACTYRTGGYSKTFDYLLCRQCGHEVLEDKLLVNIVSPVARHTRNATILGRNSTLIQLFQNPQGAQFEVITAKKADVFKKGKAFADFSWFPGFSWTITVCPRCGLHLGWFFQSVRHQRSENKNEEEDGVVSSFFALVLDSLLHEDFADSLLITPKSFYS